MKNENKRMCGIFAYFGKPCDEEELRVAFGLIAHRGPDDTKTIVWRDKNTMLFLGFHRLSINGKDNLAAQPFTDSRTFTICNGEIWNHKDLEDVAMYETNSGSDCECLQAFFSSQRAKDPDQAFVSLCRSVDGVFGLVMFDKKSSTLYIGRDRLGIRSLYHGTSSDGYFVSSELKSLSSLGITADPFPPGNWGKKEIVSELVTSRFWSCKDITKQCIDESTFQKRVHDLLTEAVRKRFMSDRSVGCVLSGGLDSTIVTAIAVKIHHQRFPDAAPLRTYTIGMEGSTDIAWARKAAEYLGTEHHEFILSEDEFLEAIPHVIEQIESYDITTVRASVGNWLVAKKIAKLGKDSVVFCGDVADELFGGYRGFGLTDDPRLFKAAQHQMLEEIHRFDVLRCEKSFAGHGLEGRVPFGDRDLLDLVLSCPAELLMWGSDTGKIEKESIRRAFVGYLPKDILWRRKEAFSDGVSSTQRSWHEVVKSHCRSTKITKRHHLSPYDPESALYRQIFTDNYGDKHAHVVPRFWKHPFTTVSDPSARCLENYM